MGTSPSQVSAPRQLWSITFTTCPTCGTCGESYLTCLTLDERNLPPQGRIGETEDLIASVFVEGGKVIASTYEPLPSYRLVTGYGVCTLPRGLDEHVVKWLQKVDEEAKE